MARNNGTAPSVRTTRRDGDALLRSLADLGPMVARTLAELMASDDPAIRLRVCELWLKTSGLHAGDLMREVTGRRASAEAMEMPGWDC